MQKTKRQNTIRAKQKFYDYCVKAGIDVSSFEVANLQIHEIPPKRKSTLKNRAREIKKNFNCVFKPRLNFDNFPNLENYHLNLKTKTS